MTHYRIEDYFTPEAVELIHKSEIIGIDGVTEHAVVLLSCDLVPYAAMRDGDKLIHAGALIGCLPSPALALSDGLRNLYEDDILEGLRKFGVFGAIGEDIMFLPWGGRTENASVALAYISGYIPDVTLEEYDGLFLIREELNTP